MTSKQLIAWQTRMGYSNIDAHKALGVSSATYADYRRGISRTTGKKLVISRSIALACAALEEGLTVK